jgi:hypothetical protein
LAFPKKNWASQKGALKVAAFRSGLEERVAKELAALSIPYEYETKKIPYTTPPAAHTYTPDFILPNGIIVETKGYFDSADRTKHVLVKAQHPELDIRFVFSNANTKLSKTSLTTYAAWCLKRGFLFATKSIPIAWLREPSRRGL